MAKRRGNQFPTYNIYLSDENTDSKGIEAVELYNKSERKAQEWQENLLFHIMAVDDDGLWIHSRFGYSVPRQNGKNEIIAIRELWGIRNGERILHTAHRTSTSRSAWERLVFLLESIGISEKSAANPDGYTSGKSKGQEFIFLPEVWGGGRIQFRTRTTTGGLGETFDLLVIDEAQEYQEDHESALKYTIVSSSNPQTIYLGTPPTQYSSGTKFPEFRKKVLCGEMKHAGWAEWSVEEETDMNDVDAWYLTNPSLGYKLSERAIEDEIGTDHVDFNIQRLGLWIKYNQQSIISKKEWSELELQTMPKLVGFLSFGVKFNRDGSTVAMSYACKTNDDRIFVECIDCKNLREGIEWIAQIAKKCEGNYSKIVCDGANGKDILSDMLKNYKLPKAVFPTVPEYIEGNAKFEQHLFKQTMVHMRQKSVENIVTNCEKRTIGSAGGFGYKSIRTGADIAIMDSIILAVWGVDKFSTPPKKQKISY